MRNPHLAGPWLATLSVGSELAQTDPVFARKAGTYFGGVDVRPASVLTAVTAGVIDEMIRAWPLMPSGGDGRSGGPGLGDLFAWQAAWARSLMADPVWHLRWAMEVQRRWGVLLTNGRASAPDPRAIGPDAWRAARDGDGRTAPTRSRRRLTSTSSGWQPAGRIRSPGCGYSLTRADRLRRRLGWPIFSSSPLKCCTATAGRVVISRT